jgi:protein-disulfide isomerase
VFETYPKVVKLAIKNFPLPNHKFARQAAVAALAADRQGKFWEFHDELYKNYKSLNEEKIGEIAQQVGLDKTKLDQDIKAPEVMAIVESDLREGQNAGVRGIPTIFINGRLLRDRSFAGFQAAIEKELAKEGKRKE